jgi:A/G-specific adenine glycosylase
MDIPALRQALLGWYHADARALAWRVGPREHAAGVRADPYRVWLSEVMLQQTTVAHATPYFLRFTERWPTVSELAAAEDGEVMAAWAGLGYYARARNLLACARAVAGEHGGVFPDTEAGLRALPGLGAYTAAAVAAIAFDRPAAVVDGNVERVTARLFAVHAPLPDARAELRRLAGDIASPEAPGNWAQATMDLGAVICRPKSPLCPRCPVEGFCRARAEGDPGRLPLKRAKAERPRRFGQVYVALRGREVALVRRPAKGLLGGMLGLPTTAWTATPPPEAPPTAAEWRSAGEVEHIFTHFALVLQVLRAEVPGEVADAAWTPLATAAASLPTVFRKALEAALDRMV